MPKVTKANGGAITHIYLAVECDGCKFSGKPQSYIIVKYLGLHDGRAEYEIPDSCPFILRLHCPKCDKITRYCKEDILVIGLPYPPESGFVEQF
jgi:hypothetical protein